MTNHPKGNEIVLLSPSNKKKKVLVYNDIITINLYTKIVCRN